MVDGRRIEVNIGNQALAVLHVVFNFSGQLEPNFVFCSDSQFLCHLAQVFFPRVLGLVDPVAKAHDFFLGIQFLLQIGLGIPVLSNFLQHVEDFFIGTTVKRTLEGTDGCGDTRVDI